MDMQPNRNMAVENQLQAVQLGASLYDRAQTQKRMMEQFQLQSAESVMRQRQSDLNNKVQTFELGRAMKNQEDELADVDNMASNVSSVDTFFVDPNAPFPTFKPVKSAKNQGILNQYRQQLDDFSTRRRLMNGVQETNKIVGNQLGKAIEFANSNGLHDVVWQNDNGLNQYGQLDMGKAKLIIDAVAPKMSEKTTREKNLSEMVTLNSIASLGQEAIDLRVASGQMTPQEGQIAKSAAASKQASKSPLTAALADWQRSTEDQKDAKFQVLKAVASKSGQDIIVGPSGEFEFKKALPREIQVQLFNGIRSANTALDILENIKDADIDDAFGFEAALRSKGQKVGLANVGFGLNKAQITLRSTLGTLTPMVARGLLSENGRLTNDDARRAAELIAQSFATSSPDQVKQNILELKEKFQKAKDRMKSPFGIIGEMELQNIDRKTPPASGQGAGGSFEQPTSPASEQGTNAAALPTGWSIEQ